MRRHDFGGNFGGPIARSGPLANKLFGFVNFEMEWIPQTQTRSQTTLTEEARQGIFRYVTAAGEQRTVNVLEHGRRGRPAIDARPDHGRAAGQEAERSSTPRSNRARRCGRKS